MASQPRGNVIIDQEECKGCGLCVDSCPPECLELAPELNAYGVHPAQYTGEDCTGCGACYYCCPEPGAITVERLTPPAKIAVKGHGFSRAETRQESSGFSPGAASEEVPNAAAL
jgi:2-oxoglutarate ferredoxin oxidoreductase subunit delta